MTLQNKDRLSLIKYRLIQAEETVLDVELLIANNRYRSAVNRILSTLLCQIKKQ